MSNSDFEDLDPSTSLDDLEVKSSDQLQDLNGRNLVPKDDCGRYGVNGSSAITTKIILAGIGYRMQSIGIKAVLSIPVSP
jgi:hypothetical protein